MRLISRRHEQGQGMNGDIVLAIDHGTQSARALAFDAQGDLVTRGRVPVQPYFSEHPGWAEQHPERFWDAIALACRALFAERPDLRDRVAAVTLTTQRGTVINLDKDGQPLRPAILWLDKRRVEGTTPIGGRWGALFRLVRMTETIGYFQAEAEANWILREQPDIWVKTTKYLLLSGYLTYRLTGRYADSIGCQVGYIPFDYKGLCWAGGGDWKWLAVPGIDRAMLPDLVTPGDVLGTITPEAAAAIGVRAGTPMIAAAADKACEVLGSGGLDGWIGCISYGTTATINSTQRRYVEAIPLIPPYPSAVPHQYNLEIQIYRGYWMVEWFKRQFSPREVAEAAARGVDAERLLDELIAQAPAGSDGLIVQPYWSPGLKIPGPEARGAMIGFTDVHTRAHVYRAMLEGLAYALREGKARIERRTRTPITELRVSGGGAQSDPVLQLTADVFGLPTSRSHTFETSGLGAAIDAAVGLRWYPNAASAARSMTRLDRTFEPNPHTRAVYDDLYGIYTQLYAGVKPLYDAMRRLRTL